MRKIFCYMVVMALAVTTVAVAADNSSDIGEDPARNHGNQGERGALPEGATVLWDNGDHDGLNGYSNATVNAFGSRRTVLDDFEIPDGETWNINDFHWLHVWGTPGIGNIGTDLEICFRADAAGAPGAEIQCAVTTSYLEERTGRVYFSREENVSWSEFENVVLGGGRYWWEATIVGPENNFILVDSVASLEDCWVNYDDLGGLQSCIVQFGVGGDFSWQLTGDGGDPPCRVTANLVRQPRGDQPLMVDLSITHNRNQTQTRAFELSVVDRDGNVLRSKTTRPYTMEYGQTVNARERMDTSGLARGEYDLVISMDGMRGGKRTDSVRFRVR